MSSIWWRYALAMIEALPGRITVFRNIYYYYIMFIIWFVWIVFSLNVPLHEFELISEDKYLCLMITSAP